MFLFHKPFWYYKKHGFTLVEVLVVVLIAVLVTLFSVPAYKKMQQRNAYLETTAIVLDLGNGVNLVREQYPKENYTLTPISASAASATVTDAALQNSPTSNDLIGWLKKAKYISNFPQGGVYKGYAFSLVSSGSACSLQSWSNATTACAETGTNLSDAIVCAYNSDLQKCVWVDFSGVLHTP